MHRHMHHHMPRRSFLRIGAAVGLAAGLTLAACGDDTDEGDAGTGGAVEIEGAWARTSPMMAEAGAAYFTITSPVDDALVGASVDASVAGVVEMHETRMVETDMTATTMEGGMGDGMGDGMGEMEMVPVERIELPAGEAIALKPGGLHLMLLDLPEPLELDETFTITLTLENAGEQQVEVTVRDEAP